MYIPSQLSFLYWLDCQIWDNIYRRYMYNTYMLGIRCCFQLDKSWFSESAKKIRTIYFGMFYKCRTCTYYRPLQLIWSLTCKYILLFGVASLNCRLGKMLPWDVPIFCQIIHEQKVLRAVHFTQVDIRQEIINGYIQASIEIHFDICIAQYNVTIASKPICQQVSATKSSRFRCYFYFICISRARYCNIFHQSQCRSSKQSEREY